MDKNKIVINESHTVIVWLLVWNHWQLPIIRCLIIDFWHLSLETIDVMLKKISLFNPTFTSWNIHLTFNNEKFYDFSFIDVW